MRVGDSSQFQEYVGTYTWAFSDFDVGICREKQWTARSPGHLRHLQTNLHASPEFRRYHITWDRNSGDIRDAKWMDNIQPGDEIIVRATCYGSDRENLVKDLTVNVYSTITSTK